MDTNTIRNESGMNKTCTVCWKLKAAHEVADLNGEDICTRCAAKYIKYHHNKKLKICTECGNKLSLVETGSHILWTCTQCPVEFNDIHELTKDWVNKLGEW